MTQLGTIAVPAVGASAPTVHRTHANAGRALTLEVPVTLTRRALETLMHLAVNRQAAMHGYYDADRGEAAALGEAIRALQAAWRAAP